MSNTLSVSVLVLVVVGGEHLQVEASTWNNMSVTVLYTSAGQCFSRHFCTSFSFCTTVSISPVMLPFIKLKGEPGCALMTAADCV